MKRNKLLNNSIIFGILLSISSTSCNKEEYQSNQDELLGNIVTINATRSDDPLTRTEYDDTNSSKLIVKWKSDKSDKIGVFTSDGGTTNSTFTVKGELSANGKFATFQGPIGTSGQNISMYSYYPWITGQTSSTAIAIDLLDQQQVDINTTSHLASKDFMAATPQVTNLISGNKEISMIFKPLLNVMSFDIKNNTLSPMSISSVKFRAIVFRPFYSAGTVNITTADGSFPITPKVTTQSRAIELAVSGTSNTIAPNATARFSMMMLPISATSNPNYPLQFRATVSTTDGKIFIQNKTSPVTGFTRGGRSIMAVNNLVELPAKKSITIGGVKFDFVLTKSGAFQIGSPDTEIGRNGDETQHWVRLTQEIYVGVSEVTQAQWKAIMGVNNNPSNWKDDTLPVETVSWDDINAPTTGFFAKLNALGLGVFRLPTESEWEYAARGGQKSTGYLIYPGTNDLLTNFAWFTDNSAAQTHQNSLKTENALRVFDMAGNVNEWCSDKYGTYPVATKRTEAAIDPEGATTGSTYVIRGGSFESSSSACRSASRASAASNTANKNTGFRIVLVP